MLSALANGSARSKGLRLQEVHFYQSLPTYRRGCPLTTLPGDSLRSRKENGLPGSYPTAFGARVHQLL